jgi:RNA-splicing ligase RtcB
MSVPQKIDKITDMVWEFPTSYRQGMRVPARIYATEKLLSEMDDGVFEQVTNVAMLPGIVKYALCMPDGHWGYGFPIGGSMETGSYLLVGTTTGSQTFYSTAHGSGRTMSRRKAKKYLTARNVNA